MPPERPTAPPGQPLGILLLSGGHERAHYAMMLAAGAAALGREVVVFATNEGCRLFADDAPTAPIRDPRDGAVQALGVAGLAELFEAAEALGIAFMACDAGLRMAGLPAAALRPGVTVAGIPTFLARVGTGQIITL